jgi:uncharacterized membrane protein
MSENKSEIIEDGTSSEIKKPEINPQKLERYMEQLRLEQNLPMGLLGGIAATFIAAFLWAVITVVTKYQIGYMAIAVGFIVGFAVRFTGKGIDKTFGIMGAVLALAGCLIGNFFSIIGIIAGADGLGYI